MGKENFSTEFNDTTGAGEISLYENPFKNGAKKYYGRFNRTTVDTTNLISRLQKNGSGKNLIAVKETITMVKKEVLDAVASGETVDLMGLVTIYLAPTGGFDGTSDESGDQNLTVKLTPSAELKAAAKNVKIKSKQVKDTSPVIENITDQFTGKNFYDEDFVLSHGMNVVLSGTRLKVAGDEGGVFIAPVDEHDALVSDEGQWLKSNRISRNLPKTLEFYLPSSAKAGSKYRIVLRTSFSNSKTMLKKHIDIISEIVTIKTAS